MSGKVIFSLTAAQAEALAAIREGRRVPGPEGRSRNMVFQSLRARGFIKEPSRPGANVTLTELGWIAAFLSTKYLLPPLSAARGGSR